MVLVEGLPVLAEAAEAAPAVLEPVPLEQQVLAVSQGAMGRMLLVAWVLMVPARMQSLEVVVVGTVRFRVLATMEAVLFSVLLEEEAAAPPLIVQQNIMVETAVLTEAI